MLDRAAVRNLTCRREEMTKGTKPITAQEYERMAAELEAIAAAVRGHPDMNHHFAERLTLMAKQMREDMVRLSSGSSKGK